MKGPVHVSVVLGQPLAQTVLVSNVRGADTGGGLRFDQHMRGCQDQCGDLACRQSGMDQRDGGAITVAEQDRLADPGCLQDGRQRDPRLIMHIVDRARAGQDRRSTMAVARIYEDLAPRGLGQPRRKIPPHGNRTEPFMQHDDGR